MTTKQEQGRGPIPWRQGTGRYGLCCGRLVEQHQHSDRKRFLLPLPVIDEELPPEIGDLFIARTAPVRGIGFTIAQVERTKLSELTDAHYEAIGQDKPVFLSRWDELNAPRHRSSVDPEVMLLWLLAGH